MRLRRHEISYRSRCLCYNSPFSNLLKTACDQNRIFITRDRDFGGLVFVEKLGPGVIYLRMLPSTIDSIHKEMKRVLKEYSEEDLQKAFVVVEAGRHRHRRIKQLANS